MSPTHKGFHGNDRKGNSVCHCGERIDVAISGCGSVHNEKQEPPDGAPREQRVIPGSFATPEAIAQINVQKLVMGSPLVLADTGAKRSAYPSETPEHIQPDSAGR